MHVLTVLTKPYQGMHKHFRMMALSEHLRNRGCGMSEHTRIPGIWKKLDSLYDLEALDQRENHFIPADLIEGDENGRSGHEFALPSEEFGIHMFERRLAPEGSISPPTSTRPPSAASRSMTATRRNSTVEDTEDPRSSPASVREIRASGGPRGTRSTRRSQLNEVSSLAGRNRPSRASAAENSAEAPNDEEKEASNEAEDEDHSAEDEIPKTSKTRSTRRRSGRKK
ncbi:MAG: hypothetical protein Q9203_004762 [Teloschistes exilis]